MKNQLIFLFSLVSLLACQQGKKLDVFYPKIDALAKRYEALGRFSGTILIAQKDKVLFHKSYSFADYENSTIFSDTSIFKIEPLGELFTEHVTKTLDIQPTDYEENQTIIEQYCLENGLKHTFYQRTNTTLVKGYLFHNYRGQGLELEEIKNKGPEKRNDAFYLKSTALDLLRFASLLQKETIKKGGFMNNSGFSHAFYKTKDLTVIILSNRRHPICEEMAKSIQAIYKNEPYELPLPRIPFDIDTKLYIDYTGIYQVNPDFIFEVTIKNDSLFTVINGQETHAIPQSNDQFYYQDFDAAIQFVRDSNEVVSKAVLYNGFLDGNEVLKIKS